ncbi:ruBisCO large subunit-binding protein subunit alpha, chloroplastic-like [Gossypium australe]|uniref:RuBisCO large subunit-binding protein subunit alpha, chloroplastic-like n=1 Tax=Gossypium australe TaxID=47621 RepID=A0A5B6VXB6_9ROSI|nr:ruBisCO large subunit-binding protein subunit alpha, chloroplastic-like [Gossypium australe]
MWSLDLFIRDCPEVGEKEKSQNARPGSVARGRPQKNLGNEMSNKNPSKKHTARVEGRAPARTYSIRSREKASSPDVITVTYGVIVNCGKKLIELKNEKGDFIRVESDEQDRSPIRYLRKGYEAYLAFVMNTKETDLKIESVPIVCEYPDVFLVELPRVPPTREIEFGIELAPGTAPISIAPYRMAPTELKELKAQL